MRCQSALGYSYFQHFLVLPRPYEWFIFHSWLAVELRRSFYQMDIFFVFNSHDMPIVLDAYQQPASVCVGEGGNRAGNLLCIGYEIFEILMQMFPLSNHFFKLADHKASFLIFKGQR